MDGDDAVMERLEEWKRSLSAELGVDPEVVDVDGVLALAGEAAHAVARPAAPVTAFVVGYAAALAAGRGISGPEAVARALRSARRLCAGAAGA